MNSVDLFGRRKITTNYTKVTDENIIDILEKAFADHMFNVVEEDYLFDYVRGNQPILYREKKIRKDINNKIVINKAKAVVDFKAGYLLEKPIQYVSSLNSTDDEAMKFLNGSLANESKDSQDMEIATDMAICGLGYRFALSNKNYKDGEEESPFKLYHIKPRNAFRVYTADIGGEALLGVVWASIKNEAGHQEEVVTAYTEDKVYKYVIGSKTKPEISENTLGMIPLFEYEYDELRMGAFEPVIPIYDAISLTMSNRVDGVEQFIQALLVFKNVDIKKEQLTELIELGAIKIKDNGEVEANVEYLTQELNQTQVQTLIDCMFEIADDIVGMPVQKSGTGGDNGVAVVYKDGWTKVESKTQKTELCFKKAERQFLKLILKIMRIKTLDKMIIKPIDVEIKFTRRNYENIYTKAQTLDLLLKNPHVHPRLAFVYSGISADPEADFNISEKYYNEQVEKAKKEAEEKAKKVKEEGDPNGLQN